MAFLWLHLINRVRIEWTVNPAYTYGWAVPFFCCYLIWRRLNPAADEAMRGTGENLIAPALALPSIACFALFYFLTRLVEEANPDWRLVSALLALETICLTLLSLRLVFGASFATRLLFPLAYFLVAVPWPTAIEAPLIQALTRSNAAIVVELLGWLRIPAVQHGNLIEIATGVIGVEEACSGIRSLQATLMLSLFFGEVYRLGVRRRVALVLTGFALAILFNIVRTFFLVWLVSRRGVQVLEQWHDSAGVGILLACFFVLWGFAGIFRRKSLNTRPVPEAEASPSSGHGAGLPGGPARFGISTFRALLAAFSLVRLRDGFAFVACLFAIELSVESWYRAHERNVSARTVWSVDWPRQNLSWQELPLSQGTKRLLRCDQAVNAAWTDEGVKWQGIFLRWDAGASAAQLARSHTPEVCLTAAGHKVLFTSDLRWADVNGLRMPYQSYDLQGEADPFHVFYLLWDDRRSPQPFATASMTWRKRFQAALSGQRNGGQRSLELAVWGFHDPQAAEAAYIRELTRLVQPGK